MDEFTKKSVEKFSKDTVRQAEKLVDRSPELKKIRAMKDGLKQSDIMSGTNSQQYKDNYDQIDWGKRLVENTNYKLKVNGKYIDREEKSDD